MEVENRSLQVHLSILLTLQAFFFSFSLNTATLLWSFSTKIVPPVLLASPRTVSFTFERQKDNFRRQRLCNIKHFVHQRRRSQNENVGCAILEVVRHTSPSTSSSLHPELGSSERRKTLHCLPHHTSPLKLWCPGANTLKLFSKRKVEPDLMSRPRHHCNQDIRRHKVLREKNYVIGVRCSIRQRHGVYAKRSPGQLSPFVEEKIQRKVLSTQVFRPHLPHIPHFKAGTVFCGRGYTKIRNTIESSEARSGTLTLKGIDR